MSKMNEPLKISIFYFMFYAAISSWMAFFNVHLEGLGFTGLQIGTINSLFISSSIVVVPLGGMLSDRFGANRMLLVLTTGCAGLIYFTGTNTTYWSIIAAVLMLSLFQSPVGAVMDGMTLGLVKSTPRHSFGKLRLWGSAGYAVGSLLSGYLASWNSSRIFTLAAVIFAILSVINLLTLPPKPVTGRGLVNFSSFGVFFKNKQIFAFFILIFLFGISISPLHYFINLYYTEINATGTQIGLAIAIQASFEIPFFIFGARYLKRTNAENVIILAMGVSLIRMVLYGFIHNPIHALPVGILHGFTISFFIIGVVEYVQNQTPSHLRTTGQSLIWAFHFGAGLMAGNIWIGYLKDLYGMHKVMHIQSVFAGCIIILTVLFFKKVGLNPHLRKPPLG